LKSKRRIALIACLLVVGSVPAAHAATPPGFHETVEATGQTEPTAIAFLPSGKMLITEKGGTLWLVGGARLHRLIDIPVCTDAEMGLLGVAADPAFATNGYVYLYRTKAGPSGCSSSSGRYNQVVRVTVTGSSVDPSSLKELLTGIRTDNGNHDGGGLRIGPDWKLYVSVGDSGLGDANGLPGSSTNPYAQSLGELNGKLLRLELSGAPAAGNPFIGTAGARPEIFAYGFRNPFRFGFDPNTGRLWAADVGQNNYEELDIVSAGGNYAWPRCEGTEPAGCMQAGDVSPIFTYAEGTYGRTMIGGGFAPRGFGAYQGQYFFGDYVANKVYRLVPNASRDGIAGSPVEFVTGAPGPVDVVFGPGGALYYAAISSGEVRQVAPAYDSPASAVRIGVPLVPAFRQTISSSQCSARGGLNGTHGPPLSLPSCNPPQYKPGTSARVGSRSIGTATVTAVPGDPATSANEADIALSVAVSDVRSIAGGGDYQASSGGADVKLVASLRLSDDANGPLGTRDATTANFQLPLTANCVPTSDTSLGSSCNATSGANAIAPGSVVEGRESVLQVFRVHVDDSGTDGTLGTADDGTFAQEGVFVR
jgi:glucose/arabinose dehydrogenase